MPGTYGVDAVALPGVDVVARIDALPFAGGSIGSALALNVLEHLPDLAAAMSEIHRVLRDHGRCTVEVPYFTSVSAYADPTHVRWFTFTTFEHFSAPAATGWQANRHTWFTGARFRITARRLVFGKFHHLLGIAWWANRLPRVYENLFAYWFPARALRVELAKAPLSQS